MAVVLALLASVLWGISDYSGGKVSRRHPTLVVACVSQASGALLAGVVVAATGTWVGTGEVLAWGVGAGLSIAVTAVLFYRALAIGSMSVVAPIAATGVVIPVVLGLAYGAVPSVLACAGIVVAVIGVVAAARTPAAGIGVASHRRSVVLAAGAAVGFGLLQVTTAGGAQQSPLSTLLVMRATSTALLAVVLAGSIALSRTTAPRASRRLTLGATLAMVAVGVVDVSANTSFAFASVGDDLAVVSVLAALYPAVTVLLARVVDRERLGVVQQLGVVAAFAGVVLIALG